MSYRKSLRSVDYKPTAKIKISLKFYLMVVGNRKGPSIDLFVYSIINN